MSRQGELDLPPIEVHSLGRGASHVDTEEGESRQEDRLAYEEFQQRLKAIHPDDYNMTLQQVADEIGVTRERVRQIEQAAFAKIRKRVERGELPIYEVYKVLLNE